MLNEPEIKPMKLFVYTCKYSREILEGTGIEILPVVIDGRSCTTPADIDDRVQVEIAGDRIIRIDGLG